MVWEFISGMISYIWWLFVDWLKIFFAPLSNFEMLWILIPIYLSWIFSEFFQEKHETDFGNAISNGVVALWVGFDWVRLLIHQTEAGIIFAYHPTTIFKFLIAFGITIYGIFIIAMGIKTRRFVMFAGRIREVTYLLLMFTPVIYGVINLSWRFALIVAVFFPVFYWIVEWIDRIVPDPRTYAAR